MRSITTATNSSFNVMREDAASSRATAYGLYANYTHHVDIFIIEQRRVFPSLAVPSQHYDIISFDFSQYITR